MKREERAECKDRAEGCERWLELEKKIKVLMFLTESPATSVCDSLLYLARIILFRASMSAAVAVVVFVFVCLSSRAHPNVWGGGGGGDGETSRVGLDLPVQIDLSVYLDIFSLKLVCVQLSSDSKYSKTGHPLQRYRSAPFLPKSFIETFFKETKQGEITVRSLANESVHPQS